MAHKLESSGSIIGSVSRHSSSPVSSSPVTSQFSSFSMGTAVQADPREPADPEKIKFMIFFERCTWKHCNGYDHNGFSMF